MQSLARVSVYALCMVNLQVHSPDKHELEDIDVS